MQKKKCWQCAELINIEALVCPLCRGQQAKHTPAAKPLTKTEVNRILGIIGAVVVLGAISVSLSSKRATAPEKPQSSIGAGASSAQSSGPASYKVEILAMRRLKGLMRDPESMQTRNVRVPPGAAFLCGEVNGANAYGGKAGYKRFMVGGTSEMPAVVEGDGQMKQSEFDDAWRRVC